jgi:uncharacterized membrane protein
MEVTHDARLELAIGRVLQAGVLLAASCALIGGVLMVTSHAGSAPPPLSMFHGVEPVYAHPIETLKMAFRGSGPALMQTGILVLIATPIFRVGASLVLFAIRRDWLYVVVTLVVVVALTLGLLGYAE